MRIELYPNLGIESLVSDDALNVSAYEDGDFVTFKGKEEGLYFQSEEPEVIVEDGAMPLLKYLVEKHDLLVCAIDDFADTASSIYQFVGCGNSDLFDAVITDYATFEMIAFADEYGWSEDFLAHLKELRKNNRERLGVKTDFKVGDILTFNYCEEESLLSMSGKIIYVDNLHAIAHITANTRQLMAGLNRNSIPHEDVAEIVGRPIEELIEKEYDEFIDMYDPLSYLAQSPFKQDLWITPLNTEPI